jgi:hypothetical protein
MMYFKGNMLYFNNLTISIFGLAFLLYVMFQTRKFVNFYKKKFYLVFAMHFYALLLNGAHALIIQHKVVNATLVTEACLLILMSCFFGATVIWTYNYYLKFLYSLITERHFKTFTRLLYPLAFWKRKNRDYYDYDNLELTSTTDEEIKEEYVPSEEDEILQNGWFRYMNYQILGNYLLTQMFNLYAVMFTYFIRMISISLDITGTFQLTYLSIGISGFVSVCLFFDFRYRMFTKSLIMPHLTILVLMGTWMFEHYKESNMERPEPVSVCTFIYLFIYIVIKFAFLTDISSMQLGQKKKKDI